MREEICRHFSHMLIMSTHFLKAYECSFLYFQNLLFASPNPSLIQGGRREPLRCQREAKTAMAGME